MTLIELGATAVGAVVGLLTTLLLYPIYDDKKVSADQRIRILRTVILIIVVEFIGPGAGFALLSSLSATAGYGLGLLAGFLGGYAWQELKKLGVISRVVRKAKRHPRDARRALEDPDALDDPEFRDRLKQLLDDLGDDSGSNDPTEDGPDSEHPDQEDP